MKMSNQLGLNSNSSSYEWEHKNTGDINTNNSAFTSVPKLKCPPAKPPRRKLSYPNDSTKCCGDDSFNISNTRPVNVTRTISNSNISISVGVANYNDTLSKSSSSASSKGLSTSGTEGSDYGSLQGDALLLNTKKQNVENDKYRRDSVDSYYCSSTPKVPERRRNSIQVAEAWPSILSPASVYYTPTGTPKSAWTTTDAQQQQYEENQKAFKLVEKILAQKSSSIYRRHNSDPQIALERRPSRRALRQRAADRRSHSFVGFPEDTPLRGRTRLSKHWDSGHSCRAEGSNYHLLSEEVKMLREMCDKLWDQLRQTQLKLELLQNKATCHQSSPSFSDLLSEVYYAQRDRDKAVQERLELSMTERRYLLAQVDNLREVIFRKNMQNADTSDEDFENQEETVGVDKVLKGLEICNSPSKLEEHRECLLKRVKQFKNSRQATLSQQLNKVTAQRDSALARLKVLTEEVQAMRWDSPSRSSMGEVFGENNSTKRVEEIKEKLSTLNLSIPASQQNKATKSIDSELEDICCYYLDKTDNTEDVALLKVLLNAEHSIRMRKEEECKKLERMVVVLRKKLAGNSLGIAV